MIPRTAALVQQSVLAAAAAALGVGLNHATGLRAPCFEALASGASPVRGAIAQIGPGLAGGLVAGGAAVALSITLRRWAGHAAMAAGERLRLAFGLPARLLMGGVFEEIVYRWGLMGAIAWVGAAVAGTPAPAVMWTAIVLAALVFGMAHLPGAAALGAILGFETGGPLIVTGMAINVAGGIVFGWVFWTYGLLAAMLSHATAHVALVLYERSVAR